MENPIIKSKIYKMGPKLGLYFPNLLIQKFNLKIGDYVSINLNTNGKSNVFLSKFNNIITLKRRTINEFKLIPNQSVNIILEKVCSAERLEHIFNKNKIDLLALIPLKNCLDSEILVNEFVKNNEFWLKIWCCHKRGSCREFELKRFIDVKKFGKFLGLMQSEGTKTNLKVVEFCNKSITEHLDFLSYLEELGISKNEIIGKFDYHPRIKDTATIILDFEKRTGIKIRSSIPGPTSGGGYGFKLIIRSSPLSEIVLNCMNKVRDLIKHESSNEQIVLLRDAFFSKLLSGDGTIDLILKNRKKPEARLKIVDGNLSYLEDYKKIMEAYDLVPHITPKHKYVRCYINYKFTEKLIHMGAFEENPNYAKLQKFLELIKINNSSIRT